MDMGFGISNMGFGNGKKKDYGYVIQNFGCGIWDRERVSII